MPDYTYTVRIKGGNKGETLTLHHPGPLTPGQAVQLPDTGDWHLVLTLRPGKRGWLATVSQPADSPQAALTEAARYKHWP